MATDAPSNVTRRARARRLRGIYVIVNDSPNAVPVAQAAVRAGVRVLQYRAKGGVNVERLSALRRLTSRCGALLLLDDDWRAALANECDGVHLGPGDEGFGDAGTLRANAPGLLIGLSCGTPDEVSAATAAGVDYLGIGSVFATESKGDAGAPIGLERLRRLAAATPLPVAAIGGITAHNLRQVRGCGVAMAAVIGAVANADDPERAASALIEVWNAAA